MLLLGSNALHVDNPQANQSINRSLIAAAAAFASASAAHDDNATSSAKQIVRWICFWLNRFHYCCCFSVELSISLFIFLRHPFASIQHTHTSLSLLSARSIRLSKKARQNRTDLYQAQLASVSVCTNYCALT